MTRHEPDAAGRTHRLLSWPEWVMTRLGLPAVTDPTLAARTLAVDVATGRYVPGRAGIPDGLLSPIVATGEAVAPLPSRVAASLGLPAGVRYVVGGFDQAMATLGAGVVDAGVAHDGAGSWEAVSARVAGRVPAPASLPREWSVGPAAVGGRLEAMTSWPGGLALRWVSALATGGVPGDGSVARAIASMPADLPRLAVSMAQEPGRAGAIVGLDLSVRHGDIVLGVLVGLAHRLRHALADLDAAGAPVRLLRVTGGGARSGRWLQLKADATGTPVERPVVGEAGAFAAAVLAGSAIGALPDPRDAVRALVRVADRFEPDPAGMAWHDAHAEAQTALADALEGLVR
jgi:xylulokinase